VLLSLQLTWAECPYHCCLYRPLIPKILVTDAKITVAYHVLFSPIKQEVLFFFAAMFISL
jgi:hypothetical protein